jgi:dTDP-4-dehydrorhamnose reductase
MDADAPAGIYHATNSGQTSWYGFARAIFEEAGLDPARVLPTGSASYARPARRPAYSVLGHDAWEAAGLAPLRPWREALAAAAASGVLATPATQSGTAAR